MIKTIAELPATGASRLRDEDQNALFLGERSEAGLAASSVRIIHTTRRTMLAEAVRDEPLERNVASIVRGSRSQGRR